jgi:CubicO group peptidase (beta-lactamase class C family)
LRRILLSVVGVLLFVHVPASAQAIVYEVFSTYLDSLREQAGIPGLAAAIVDDERVAWEQAYGRQDVDRAIATRTDTPFNAVGLTQVFTATMVLQCVEERRLSLDDRVGSFSRVETLEPDATIRQLLTHTSGPPENLTYSRRLDRLAPLWPIVRACAVDSYRETFANLLERLSMNDSVPGANIINIASPAEGVPHPADVARYEAVLQRRATPYAVDDRGRASKSSYPNSAEVLSPSNPSNGLITTVRDLAKFAIALRQEDFLSSETLGDAWTPPAGADRAPLPHATGWFVQTFRGEKVVWQYGMAEDASSCLMITLPARGLTLILMANSDGLVKLFSPSRGDVTRSPFGRLFLNMFVR